MTPRISYPMTADLLTVRIHARYPHYDLVGLEGAMLIEKNTTDITIRCSLHDIEFSSRPAYLTQNRTEPLGHCYVCVPRSKGVFFPAMMQSSLDSRCPQPMRYVDTRYGVHERIYCSTKIEVECLAPLPSGDRCGHRWRARIGNLLSGYGCPECARRRRKARGRSCDQHNEWLSDYGLRAVERSRGRALIECPSGHRFELYPAQLQKLKQQPASRAARRQWCPICSKRLQYHQHQRLANAHGLDLLTPLANWKGKLAHYDYRCQRDPKHRFHTTPPALSRWIGGCVKCRAKQQRAVLLQECAELAARRGGELIPGQQYETCTTKLACRCADGHTFKISRDKLLQGTWCPTCMSRFGERLTIYVMEHMFGVSFAKMRPAFLRNETGYCLEFDGYNDELKVAVEHQGDQHTRRIAHWHKSKADYQAMQARDQKKRCLAHENGIKLVEVRQLDPSMTKEQVLAHIGEACRSAGLKVPSYDPNIDISPVFRGSSNQVRLERIVREHGGEMLTPYQGLQRKIKYKCANPSHPPWRTTPFITLYSGSWCPRCSAQAAGKKTHEHHARRVMSWLASVSGLLVDGPYRGPSHRHRWVCQKGHILDVSYLAIGQRRRNGIHWCRYCEAERRRADRRVSRPS